MKINKVIVIGAMLLIVNQAYGAWVNFYGHVLDIPTEALHQVKSPSHINQQNIHYSQRANNKLDLSPTTSSIRVKAEQLNLDDFGVLMLCKRIAAQVSRDKNQNEVILYNLLKELNYNVKLTYNNSISTFGQFNQNPAASVYIMLNGERYSQLNFDNRKLQGNRFIYKESEQQFPVKRRSFVFEGSAPKLNAKLGGRLFTWSFQGKAYQLKTVTNESLNEYLDDIPQFELGKSYLTMSASHEFKTSVLQPLETLMQDMHSLGQKADFLLHFVQKTLTYKSDYEQYGRENYNFPEETVNNQYSDCEDRTILLAYLCNELLNMESVMLHFEKDQHVCLGLKMPNRSNSWSFKYKDEPYIVAEPTGENLSLGKTGISLSRVTNVIDLF